jgi:hypothetical protein
MRWSTNTPRIRRVSMSDTDTTLTLTITLNCLIFSNYYRLTCQCLCRVWCPCLCFIRNSQRLGENICQLIIWTKNAVLWCIHIKFLSNEMTIYLNVLKYSMYFIHAAILQFPAIHKKKPQRSGYQRAKINRKMTLFLH